MKQPKTAVQMPARAADLLADAAIVAVRVAVEGADQDDGGSRKQQRRDEIAETRQCRAARHRSKKIATLASARPTKSAMRARPARMPGVTKRCLRVAATCAAPILSGTRPADKARAPHVSDGSLRRRCLRYRLIAHGLEHASSPRALEVLLRAGRINFFQILGLPPERVRRGFPGRRSCRPDGSARPPRRDPRRARRRRSGSAAPPACWRGR